MYAAKYKELGTFKAVANWYGVSRQAVEQSIRNWDTLFSVKKHYDTSQWLNKICRECHRLMDGKKLKGGKGGLCHSCKSYIVTRNPHLRKTIRHILYPPLCSLCKKPTVVGKRIGGMCSPCYQKHNWATNPAWRAKRIESQYRSINKKYQSMHSNGTKTGT